MRIIGPAVAASPGRSWCLRERRASVILPPLDLEQCRFGVGGIVRLQLSGGVNRITNSAIFSSMAAPTQEPVGSGLVSGPRRGRA